MEYSQIVVRVKKEVLKPVREISSFHHSRWIIFKHIKLYKWPIERCIEGL